MDNLRLLKLMKALQKTFDKVSGKNSHEVKYVDISNIDLSEPALVLLDKRVAFLYKRPEWNIVIACTYSRKGLFTIVDWAETKLGSNAFTDKSFHTKTIPTVIENDLKKLILKKKSEYLRQVDTILQKDIAERFSN